MIDDVNKEVISFLFKGDLPSHNSSDIQEAKQVKQITLKEMSNEK